MSSKTLQLRFVDEEAGVREFALDNGLKVLLVHNPSAPVVTVQVVYRVGSRNEAVGYTGATHFLEHMLFRGTPSFNKSKGTQIAQVLNKMGANFNATTWLDRTTYYETVPADQLELALHIESERMSQAYIRDKDRKAEMTVVRNEFERDENEPDSVMWKHLFAHAFMAHPYHHPTIGWHSDVEGMPTSRLRQFYKSFYHPNNASLILVGDYDEEQALKLICDYFAEIPPSPKAIPHMYTQEFAQEGERRFELRRPGQLGLVQMAYHVPPMEHPDSHALDVLQDILSEGENSRLYQALVEPQHALYAGAFNLQLRDPGLFILHSKLSLGAEHAQVESLMDAEIKKIQEDPPEPRELQRVKNQVHAAFSYQRHGAHQLASMLAEFEAAADWRFMVRYLEALNRVTEQDVQRVAQKYLQPHNRTVGHFYPGEVQAIELATPAEYRSDKVKKRAGSKKKRVKGKIARSSFGPGVLLTQENHLDDTLSIQGKIQAGLVFNPPGQKPLAQLTAAMLKKGSRAYSKLELSDALAQMGTSLDFRVGNDALHFSLRSLKMNLEDSLDLMQECLLHPKFQKKELDKLIKQRIDRLHQRQDSTDAMAYDLLYRQLYPQDHYHYQPEVSELIEQTQKVKLKDIKAFYQAHYSGADMLVSGVGALKTRTLKDFCVKHFAQWGQKGADLPEVENVATPAPEIFYWPMPDKPNVSIVMGHTTELTRLSEDYYPAMLANHILGQSSLSSRLGVRIRDELGLTYGIYSYFADVGRFAGPWVLSVTTHPQNVQQVLDETRKLLVDFVKKGPTAQELDEAKSSLIGSYLVHLTTHNQIASRLLQLESYKLGLDFFQRRADLISAVSAEDVMNALERHFHPTQLRIAIAGQVQEVS